MKWDQFDIEKGVWTKPSHITKQKKREHLPLSDQALIVLQDLKKLDGGESAYLFPRNIPGKPIQDVRASGTRSLKLLA